MAQVFAAEIDADRCDTACLHPAAIRPLLGRSLGADGARAVADLFSLVGDASRARILHLLAITAEPLCVRDMALVFGMTVSALSHQLRTLRERDVVRREKVGRIAYYRLVDEHVRRLIVDGVSHVAEGTP